MFSIQLPDPNHDLEQFAGMLGSCQLAVLHSYKLLAAHRLHPTPNCPYSLKTVPDPRLIKIPPTVWSEVYTQPMQLGSGPLNSLKFNCKTDVFPENQLEFSVLK